MKNANSNGLQTPLSDNDLLQALREKDQSIVAIRNVEKSTLLDAIVASKYTETKKREIGWKTLIIEDPHIQKQATQPFKFYKGAEQIALTEHVDKDDQRYFRKPKYRNFKTTNLLELALSRRSRRRFREHTVSLSNLANLFFYSSGVVLVERIGAQNIPWGFRPIPSPGGLFGYELYLVVLNSELPHGVYHYRPDINAFECLEKGDFESFVRTSCGVEPFIETPSNISAVIITTCVVERLFRKYDERALKFMYIEVGLLAQQLSLLIESLGLSSCMLGGYIDDDIADFLSVDGILESVQNVMVIGRSE